MVHFIEGITLEVVTNVAADHRINQSGTPIAFTCENRRFKTNLQKGHPHGLEQAPGSVFNVPLIVYPGGTLWLEHVEDADNPTEPCYWFMHYDAHGKPTIPLSAIMGKNEVQEMARLMASLIP